MCRINAYACYLLHVHFVNSFLCDYLHFSILNAYGKRIDGKIITSPNLPVKIASSDIRVCNAHVIKGTPSLFCFCFLKRSFVEPFKALCHFFTNVFTQSWMLRFCGLQVTLNQGAYNAFARRNGKFRFDDVPPGVVLCSHTQLANELNEHSIKLFFISPCFVLDSSLLSPGVYSLDVVHSSFVFPQYTLRVGEKHVRASFVRFPGVYSCLSNSLENEYRIVTDVIRCDAARRAYAAAHRAPKRRKFFRGLFVNLQQYTPARMYVVTAREHEIHQTR